MILIKLLVAHILGDFVLQSNNWVSHKKEKKLGSIYLYIHSLFIGILSYLFLANWNEFTVPLIIFVSHLLIDMWKISRKPTSLNFALDQLFHILVIIVIWISFYSFEIENIIKHLKELDLNKFWFILFAYVFLIWPSGYIIGGITKKWQKEIENDGLEKAGMWIGWLERVLTITFVLIGQYQAIGFFIVAKSILRISVKKKEERKLTEYVLIGTMLSFSIAILVGLIVNYIIFLL